MCGIFGGVFEATQTNPDDLGKIVISMLQSAAERGSEAFGFALLARKKCLVFKKNLDPNAPSSHELLTQFIRKNFHDLQGSILFMGHARLATAGSSIITENIQPIVSNDICGVHNGIFLNADMFIKDDFKETENSELSLSASDSVVLFDLLSQLLIDETTLNESVEINRLFRSVKGAISTLFFNTFDSLLYAYTNTGSLWVRSKTLGSSAFPLLFASEKSFLQRIPGAIPTAMSSQIFQLEKNRVYKLDLNKNTFEILRDTPDHIKFSKKCEKRKVSICDRDFFSMKRCTKCILPSTYPFIEFDANGVCNFCREFTSQKYRGRDELSQLLDGFRRSDGQPDCLVGLSGGRDSSYGLHLLVKEFDMHPIAYTYDWGLTSETSRRNQSKMTAALGVEHIVRSADISKKRGHIKKNVEAWLKKPQLGMVPLFMAGDKEFYEYGRSLRNDLGLELTVFCSGCLLEQREFFVGYCGVKDTVTNTARTYGYSNFVKLKLALYYIGQYLTNISYINASLFDSLQSFISTFVKKDNFLYLYEYIEWNELEIDKTLEENYGWETDTTYGKNQWRMGDGQTAFTNFIFYTLGGFSEFDNFRSSQIREGLITREEGLLLAHQDNEPRLGSIKHFCEVTNLDFNYIVKCIKNIRKVDE